MRSKQTDALLTVISELRAEVERQREVIRKQDEDMNEQRELLNEKDAEIEQYRKQETRRREHCSGLEEKRKAADYSKLFIGGAVFVSIVVAGAITLGLWFAGW